MWLLAVLACGTSATKYPEQYANEVCTFIETCEGTTFAENYSDLDDCVDDLLDDVDVDALEEDCDFDADAAKDCLDAIRDATESCDADDLADDACAEVYDCDGGGGFGINEDTFGDAFLEKACDAGCEVDSVFYCNPPTSTGTTGDTESECTFDAEAAQECLDGEFTCDAIGFTIAPSVCANVYEC